MNITDARRQVPSTIWLAAAVLAVTAVPAFAQFQPRVPEPGMGERFHIEGSAAWWFPSADLIVQSGGSGALTGLVGTEIDAKTDLGLTDKTIPQLNLVLRPATKHKFRLQYIPINFEQTATLTRDVDFNGQRYRIGFPVTSSLKWQALRLSYEYDFVSADRGFAGFIIEDKQTDVRVDLVTPFIPAQYAQAQWPIPAIGGIGRVYATPRVAITGEATFFKLPAAIGDRYAGHFVDIDIYTTVNATKYFGVQGGYRSMDLGYLVRADRGAFTMRGIYFGAVARY